MISEPPGGFERKSSKEAGLEEAGAGPSLSARTAYPLGGRLRRSAEGAEPEASCLAILGEDDAIVPVEATVARLRELLPDAHPTPVEIMVLDGAGHALDNPPGERHPAYVPTVIGWLKGYLKR